MKSVRWNTSLKLNVNYSKIPGNFRFWVAILPWYWLFGRWRTEADRPIYCHFVALWEKVTKAHRFSPSGYSENSGLGSDLTPISNTCTHNRISNIYERLIKDDGSPYSFKTLKTPTTLLSSILPSKNWNKIIGSFELSSWIEMESGGRTTNSGDLGDWHNFTSIYILKLDLSAEVLFKFGGLSKIFGWYPAEPNLRENVEIRLKIRLTT
jgi:hypothetical protein